MILFEFEGKKLLSKAGIKVPESQLLSSPTEKPKIKPPFVLKAQTLSGRRGKVGGVVVVEKDFNLKILEKIFEKEINGEKPASVLVEKKIEHKQEFYLSISYDTDFRSPVLTFSKAGGISIEDQKAEIIPIDSVSQKIDNGKIKDLPEEIGKVLPNIIKVFFENDCLLLEINPLVLDKKGEVFALDAKIKLDDAAVGRHPEWNYPPRSVAGHKATGSEIAAKKIDEGDYRGTAGSTYFDLPGDIAILASGGGGSLTAMDALLAAGGKPANYTEYSGNPPKEKVNRLAKVVLSREGLNGLWIVGAVANFTDIYETLSGFLEAIRQVSPKPKYPIVIRRGGPRDREAFEMLKKVKDLDLHLYGSEISITESARIMALFAKKYATSTKRG